MAIELPALTDITAADVSEARDIILQWAAEVFPDLDLRSAALSDVVIQPKATLYAMLEQVAERLRQSTSLVDISENPDLADETAVDRVLANFNVTRKPGAPASGQVAVITDDLIPMSIPVGFGFTSNGTRFVTEKAFAARTSASQVVADTDRLMRSIGNGRFSFVVDVVATDVGAVGVRRQTVMQLDSALPNVITAIADSDFTNGVGAETNAELLERFRTGVAPQSFADATSIEAIIRKTEVTENTIAVSVVGYGNTAQRRHHGLVHANGGGRVDVWLKTNTLPDQVAVLKEAVSLGLNEEGRTLWQTSILKTDAPGFYDVTQITASDASSSVNYQLVEDVRGYDPTGTGYVPDITTTEEAAYSAYQTSVLRFSTPEAVSAGTTREFLIYLRCAPTLQEAHDLLTSNAVIPVAGDVLVRAAVPCDVVANITIRQPVLQESVSESSIISAAVAAVGKTGFDGILSTATVASAVDQILPDRAIVAHVSLHGTVRLPNGTIRRLYDVDGLIVPNEPEVLYTRDTVCFYLKPEDVYVSIQSV